MQISSPRKRRLALGGYVTGTVVVVAVVLATLGAYATTGGNSATSTW